MILFYKILNSLVEHQNTHLILYVYRMTGVTIQKLSQSQNLFNSTAKQKASETLSFPSVLKNKTSWMLKSDTYHLFLDSKNCF